jgi:hypothetical protein
LNRFGDRSYLTARCSIRSEPNDITFELVNGPARLSSDRTVAASSPRELHQVIVGTKI